MKTDPSLDLIEDIRDTSRGKSFLELIRKQVESDDAERIPWVKKLDHFRNRRYCREFRNPEYPWPGSSSIVMPLMDKKIDELKPHYVNLITGAKPPVTILSADKESQKNAPNVELWFEWLIKFGSPRFVEAAILCVDDLLETGRGILKTGWIYEARPAPEILSYERLPERIRQLVITRDGNADELHRMTAGRVPVLSPDDLDELRPAIGEILKKEYEIDPNEPKDKAAFEQTMAWIKGGAKKPIRIERMDVVKNVPGIFAVKPQDLVVPPNSPSDVERCERLTHKMWFSEVELRQRAKSGKWDASVVNKILEGRNSKNKAGRDVRYSMAEADQALREGVSNSEVDLYQVNETCLWYSRSEGQPEKKAVMLWSDECEDGALSFREYSRPSGKWPFKTATFEFNKDRWYAPRGVPEKLDDIEYEILQQHRYKLNRQMIATAPTFKFRPGRGINPSIWRWIPGQFMPTNDPTGDVIPVQMPQLDAVFEREEQVLRAWCEEYLGGSDFGLSNPLSTMSEPRTATEIGAIGDRARQSLSMRGLIFQRMMQEVYGECFDLQVVHGSKEVWIRVTGGADPIRLTKEDMQGKFFFQPTGTIGEQDSRQEEQRAIGRIQLLASLKPMLEPKYEVDMGELVADWLKKSDLRLSKMVLHERTDEEVSKILQAQAQEKARQEQLMLLANQKPSPQLSLDGQPANGPSGFLSPTGGQVAQGAAPSPKDR